MDSLFRWDTLRVVGRHDLSYQRRPVPGTMCEVQLTSGAAVREWHADDGQQYFCHGLSFGGKDAPGGAVSPYTGTPVETILREYYQPIAEEQSRAGDVLVWQGIAPEMTPHSAILTDAAIDAGTRRLAYAARLRTKNGLSPEANATLEELINIYGETYNVYRRR